MQRWLRQSSTRVSPSNVHGINVFAHLWLMFAWYLRGIKSCSAVLVDFSEIVHQFPSKSRSGFIKLSSTQLLAVVIVAMIFALLNRQKSRGVCDLRPESVTTKPSAEEPQRPRIRRFTKQLLYYFFSIRHSTPTTKNIPATHSPPSPPTHRCTANRSLLQEYLGVWWFLWPPMSGYLWKKLNTTMSPYRPTFLSRLTC